MAASSSSSAPQDFVLFEPNTPSVFGTNFSTPDQNGFNLSSQSQAGNPAFTEYRGGDNGANNAMNGMRNGASQSGFFGNESPISSPATRFDNDFGAGASLSSSAPGMGSSISLDALPTSQSTAPEPPSHARNGPQSKRARAHGYSTSWAGDNLQQHLQQQIHNFQKQRHRQHQNQQDSRNHQQQWQGDYDAAKSNGGSPFGPQGVPMAATQSFGGFPSGIDNGSDWSGSDTSPRGPPSGSLGPPIQSLSLGDGNSEGLGTLFPATSTGNAQYMASLAGFGGHDSSQFTSPQQQQDAVRQAAAFVAAMQQEDRARQQIRADLQGVDSRALKGQLRDIQQGAGSGSPAMGSLPMATEQGNVLFPNVPPSASQSAFDIGSVQVNNDPNQRQWQMPSSQGDSSNGPSAAAMQSMMDATIRNAITAAASTSNASAPVSSTAQKTPGSMNLNPNTSAQQLLSSGVNGNRGSEPQMTALAQTEQQAAPVPSRRFSDRTQAAIDRAREQVPSRKRMVREGSGLTISPQEAFLDYNNVDSILQASRAPGIQATYAGLFGPMTSAFAQQNHAQGPNTPRANPSTYSFSEGTPSLVDASSNSSSDGNESRTAGAVASPTQRMSLNRGDTVVPSAAQKELQRQKELQNLSQNSIWSKTDPSLFSPSDSAASSTDDEDEKPYLSNRNMAREQQRIQQSHQQIASGLAQMQSHAASGRVHDTRTPQPGQRTNYTMNSGPRFSFVSSSSSESDDDSQRVGADVLQQYSQPSQNRPRTMGGYGYMGSSTESGLNAVPPSTQQMSTPANLFNVPAVAFSGENADPSFSQPGIFANNANAMASLAGPSQQQVAWQAPSEASSQSQDDGPTLSPSIRNSAQPVMGGAFGLPAHSLQPSGFPMAALLQQGVPFGAGPAGQRATTDAQISLPASNKAHSAANDTSEESMDEDGDDGSVSGSDGSVYREGGSRSSHKSKGGGRKSSASVARKRRSHEQARRASGGAATAGADGLTVCDYVSPITRETCGTEFHRPYDLARHRETIHAREEAMLLKQGQITKDQCIVLYKEVDPAKSLATVEWRCDGPHGCGALFSRKDALLRHKRIRNH